MPITAGSRIRVGARTVSSCGCRTLNSKMNEASNWASFTCAIQRRRRQYRHHVQSVATAEEERGGLSQCAWFDWRRGRSAQAARRGRKRALLAADVGACLGDDVRLISLPRARNDDEWVARAAPVLWSQRGSLRRRRSRHVGHGRANSQE